MRKAMADAAVGDDVYGEDPTVNRLEALVAERLGKDAAVFVTSGTQANLTALLSHCGRGDEYIVGAGYHTYVAEAGGAAALGGIVPQTVPVERDGAPAAEVVRAAIKPENVHLPRSRLLALENTHDGAVVPQSRLVELAAIAAGAGLASHLDGARLFNAAVASDTPVDALAAPFDSVSVCLSKGLGAPAGSVLAGSNAFIHEARHWRKMLGGGLRQAGVLAAAGLYALEHHVARLADDHARAARLGEHLGQLFGSERVRIATNMVFLDLPGERLRVLRERLAEHGVITSGRSRLVLHLDVDATALETVMRAWSAVAAA